MYLLIPDVFSSEITEYYEFTFHYVSINSKFDEFSRQEYLNLHSTMYLLIQKIQLLPKKAF